MTENETTKKDVAVSTPSKKPRMKRNAHQIRNHFCKECRWYDTSSERKFHRKVGKKDQQGQRTEIVEIRGVCRNPRALTRTGTEESVIRFYHEVVASEKEWLLKDLVDVYNEKHPNEKRSSATIGKWLQRLSEIAYVDIRKSESDARTNKYVRITQKQANVGLSEDLDSLKAKLKEGFEMWLKDIGEDNHFLYWNIVNDVAELRETTLDVVRRLVLQ